MEAIFSISWWMALGSILLIDLTMSGDNAILIALVCKNLSDEYRIKAMLIGCTGAIVIRIIFTAFAIRVLSIAYIQFIGGIILLYVAARLLTEHNKQDEKKSPSTFMNAVKTIILADLIMSVDNILSMAGVASTVTSDRWSLIICGVLISVPIIICGASVFLLVLKKFPAVIYAGGAILAFTAAKMVSTDKVTGIYLSQFTGYIEITFVAAVLLWGFLKNRRMLNDGV